MSGSAPAPKNVTQLQVAAQIDGNEVVYVADIVDGVPVDRRATVDQVVARLLALPAFAESVDDRVAALLQSGDGSVQLSYDDEGNVLGLVVGSVPAERITGLDERIRDTIGATLVEGPGVAIVVDDQANTITISATAAPPPPAPGPQGTISGTVTGVGVAATFTYSLINALTAWVVLARGGVEEGSRVAVTAGSGTVQLTPQAAGVYTAQLWDAATGGTLLAEAAAGTAAREPQDLLRLFLHHHRNEVARHIQGDRLCRSAIGPDVLQSRSYLARRGKPKAESVEP